MVTSRQTDEAADPIGSRLAAFGKLLIPEVLPVLG